MLVLCWRAVVVVVAVDVVELAGATDVGVVVGAGAAPV
jgi:hypothetical protein